MYDTLWMLQGRYQNLPIIPVERVAEDFFGLGERMFLRKVNDGEIDLPVVKLENSQKAAKGVHVKHLADFLDHHVETARREHDRIFH